MQNKPHWFAQGIFMIGLFFAASVAIMEEYRSLQGHGYTDAQAAGLVNLILSLEDDVDATQYLPPIYAGELE